MLLQELARGDAQVLEVVVVEPVVRRQDQPLFHDPVGVGQATVRYPVRHGGERRLAGHVAGPHHAGVDAVTLHVLLEVAPTDARLRPQQDREHVPPGLQPLQLPGQREHVWIRAEERRQHVEVALAPREVRRETSELHVSERRADLARLEVPSDLVEDEEVVVFDAVDVGEELAVALLGPEELRLG